MKSLLLIILLISQPAFCWFYVNPEDNQCKSGEGRFSPEALMTLSKTSSSLKCKKVSENKTKIELDCKSEMQALNGKLTFYSTLELCKSKK